MTELNGATMNGVNGTPDHVADILMDDMTIGYKPTLPLEGMWLAGTGDMPQITLRRDLEFMQMHPVVSIALDYYKSGIAGAEFWGGPDQKNPDNEQGRPISPDPHVAQFVLMHAERFWARAIPHLQDGAYPYGWAPGEYVYKEVGGMMVWSHLKPFHPNDGFILTYKNRPVGIRIKNIRETIAGDGTSGGTVEGKDPSGGMIDLWFASNHIPAKAMWYAHRPRFGQHYGRSQLIGAWRPWRRLGWRDGVEQVIDAAVYRAGYKGPVVKHPQEDMQTAQAGIPATRNDGAGNPRRSARDVARQIVEWAKAGAGFTLSSAKYPTAQGGGDKWGIDWPDHVMDVMPLVNAAKYLEDQIMLGIGVPPELVKAGGTGSGYSGRSIPREAFLDGQQRVADAMLQMFVEQVIKPLVIWNFGDIPFNIQCKPLLKSQAENKQGAVKDPLPQPGPGGSEGIEGQQKGMQAAAGKQPGPQPAPQPTPAPALSINPVAANLAVYERAMRIANRVLRRGAA
jgi:hypothetical protein